MRSNLAYTAHIIIAPGHVWEKQTEKEAGRITLRFVRIAGKLLFGETGMENVISISSVQENVPSSIEQKKFL